MSGVAEAAQQAAPLAERLRPRRLEDVVGQQHLLASGRPLRRAIESGELHSMVLWGPPGSGKTTLARLAAERAAAHFVALSAVLVGVKEVRAVVEAARQRLVEGRRTVLFLDEVHRFNKAQQDSLLPHIEDGTLVFIGATTENPAFELNNALLSRVRVYVLRPLGDDELAALVARAAAACPGAPRLADGVVEAIVAHAQGDARQALMLLELAAQLAPDDGVITMAVLDQVLAGGLRARFDRQGDLFYDLISALHKSVRGSDPDAALYWLARMLAGGCDPLYVARRVVRMASEDIGNADPRGLQLALAAWDVQQRLGSPEGELAIAQAVVYLACAPKSNAVYRAFAAARRDAERHPALEVPAHLRNAPTRLARSLGHGQGYRYAHDEPGGYAAGQSYRPPELAGRRYYEPVDRGLEARIAERLAAWRALDAAAVRGRGDGDR